MIKRVVPGEIDAYFSRVWQKIYKVSVEFGDGNGPSPTMHFL